MADEEVPQNAGVMKANGFSLRAGYNFANTTELFRCIITWRQRGCEGRYRRVTGNEALAMGCIAAAHRAQRPLLYASYPITPATTSCTSFPAQAVRWRTFHARMRLRLLCGDRRSFAGAIGVRERAGRGWR